MHPGDENNAGEIPSGHSAKRDPTEAYDIKIRMAASTCEVSGPLSHNQTEAGPSCESCHRETAPRPMTSKMNDRAHLRTSTQGNPSRNQPKVGPDWERLSGANSTVACGDEDTFPGT